MFTAVSEQASEKAEGDKPAEPAEGEADKPEGEVSYRHQRVNDRADWLTLLKG